MASTRETAFEVSLDHGIIVRIRFVRQRGQIVSFVVQLECLIEQQWYPVIRYDTAHNFAHCDVLYPDGSQDKRPLVVSDFNEALTYAQRDIKANFRRYCTRFKEWLNER
jgi:hypothetical protein